jgi:uncharacterized protein (TIGR03437 family)
VFVRNGTAWGLQQELAASDGAASDLFGSSVSLSGDTALVGAEGQNSFRGAAYMYVRSGTAWALQQKLTLPDAAVLDDIGGYTSLSGDTAVLGAPYKDGTGAAFVFVRSGTTWSLQQKLTASDAGSTNGFGMSVSVSQDLAVIGSPGILIVPTPPSTAYVFARSGGTWSQQQELTAPDGATGDAFGAATAVSGNTVVVGADSKTFGTVLKQGAAYVFTGPSLGTNSLLVGSAAGSSSVVLSSGGAWTATANSSFLHIAGGSASGTGSSVVVFTYDAFPGVGTRTGTLTIAGLTLTVTQSGMNYTGPYGSSPVFTLLSSGLSFFLGVAVDGLGNVYIADTSLNSVQKWTAATQQTSTLVASGLNGPTGVAVDRFGNVYIADQSNNAVKKWNPATRQLSTLVSSGLAWPSGVAVDSAGNVYIADSSNHAIKEWNATTQQVSTLVSSGLAFPFGVAVDVAGNVYIADRDNNAIYEWIAATGQLTTRVSSGLHAPVGAAVDGSGNVYFVNRDNNAIYEWVAATQQVATLASTGLTSPMGVAVDSSGNIYIADSFANALEEIPYAFVGPASLTEPAAAGTDSLLPVLPSTASLSGVFAPVSDANWLSIGSVSNAVVSFSFAANPTPSARAAHIAVLGQQITVTQMPPTPQTITFAALANHVLGDAPFAIAATASSGLTVSFNSQTPSVCTVNGSLVTVVAVGTCTIQATQEGDATYAAASPLSRSFTITAVPLPTITGVIGAGAFGAFSAIAPGTWIEIYGSNLAASTRTWTDADFTGNTAPTSLGGVQVTVAGQPAFIDYVSPTQVDAQVSSSIAPGTWQLTVSSAGLSSAPLNVTVKTTAPGLLAPPSFSIGGNQYVVAQLPDGNYVLPTGAVAGLASRPARPGEAIVIYGIGFGPVVPNTPAGQIAPGSSRFLGPFEVLFGQTAAELQYAGLAPGLVGLYQFNVVVPQVPDNALVPLTFSLGGVAGTQTLYTAVHQ